MSLLRTSFHIASKQLYYITVISTVLLFVLMASIVWLSNEVDKRKDEAATWIGNQIGYPVSIGSIDLYWLDLFPKLQLQQVQIHSNNSSTAIAKAERIYLGIDLMSAAQQQNIVIDSAIISGAQLAITRKQSGQLLINGLDLTEPTQSSSVSIQSVMTVLKQLELEQFKLELHDELNSELTGIYSANRIEVDTDHQQVTLDASLVLPSQLGNEVKLSGELNLNKEGSVEHWFLAVATESLKLKSLNPQLSKHQLQAMQGSVGINIDLEGEGTSLNKAKGDLAVADLELRKSQAESNSDSVVINTLTSHIDWQHTQQDWQLSLADFQLTLNGEPRQLAQYRLSQAAENEIVFDGSYINLSDITVLSRLFEDVPEIINKQQPAGELISLHVTAKQQNIEHVSTKFNDIIIQKSEQFPGITGVSGTLNWQQGEGHLAFSSYKTTLYPPKHYDEALFFDSISGNISWQQGAILALNFHNFRVWNDDFSIDVNGQVTSSDNATVTDLAVELEQVHVNRWKKYVPQQLLSDDFREWSSGAFLQGVVEKGTLSLKGDLAQFPFYDQQQQGEFKFNLATKDMELHFGEGWPNLKNVDATIVGDERKLTITSKTGTIADVKINDATTIIDRYLVNKPVLTTKGDLIGTTQQALNFLKVSPLQQRFGEIADLLVAEGTSNIDLNLLVPLTNVNSAEANGYVKFNNNQLDITHGIDLRAKDLQGKLYFDNDGVHAQELTASLFDHPITIDVAPTKSATLVEVRGNASVGDINQQWGDLLPDFFEGTTGYLAGITIFETKPGEFDLTVNVQSALTGIDIKMPSPLGKHATDIRPLSLDIKAYQQSGIQYHADYDNLVNVALAIEEDNTLVEVRIGGGKASLPKSGFAIKGAFQQLDLDDWLSWSNSLESAGGQSLFSLLDTVSINVEHLTGAEQQISALAVMAERAADDWRINIQSDQIKGRINWPIEQQSNVPASFDFDYVSFKLPKHKLKVLAEDSQRQTTLWPSVNFYSKNVRVDDMKLGEVSLLATRADNRWTVDAGILKSDTVDASVKGVWQQTDQLDTSQFVFKASSRNVKGFLADLGYQQVIESDKVDLVLDVSWPGSPKSFGSEALSGNFNIDVKKGKLLDVEPGAAGRILGLMSIATLPRRLSLDFSDLFKKGFHFKSITGDFNLNKGIATTENLVMDGESAKIEVKGPINMIDKTYQQVVTVTPQVSSTLPLAGAVAGGPVGLGVGAAILLADKIADNLFGKEIVNVISYSYHLTGPWDNPSLSTQKQIKQ